MSLRSLVPFRGNKTTRKRIKELEEKAGTLPIFFSLFVLEGVKNIVAALEYTAPFGVVFNTSVAFQGVKFFLLGIAVGILFIYEDERRQAADKAKEKAGEAKQKAGDAKDKAKEKASEVKDKASKEEEE